MINKWFSCRPAVESARVILLTFWLMCFCTYAYSQQPVIQPVIQSVQQPVVQPTQQPVIQPAQQPVLQPAQQPVIQPAVTAPVLEYGTDYGPSPVPSLGRTELPSVPPLFQTYSGTPDQNSTEPAGSPEAGVSEESGVSEDSAVSEQSGTSPSLVPESFRSPEGIRSTISLLLSLGIFTLAPAILIMTTSFVRIVVVLGLLRQALGVQNLPPQQVITALALFMTLFIMYPTGEQVYNDAVIPYQDRQITFDQAWDRGFVPVRQFMSRQIQRAGNDQDVWLFWRYDPDCPTGAEAENLTYDDVPLRVLTPAFMISELKTAFLIGIRFFIPFLIIDFLVASISVSMGIMMLPPVMISLPLKLMLFVMMDGWHLVVEMLIQSFM